MIKKLLITLIAIFGITTIKAQQASVENSISGVQLGFMSVWGYHEMRLSDNFSLRTEAGLAASVWWDMWWGSGFATYPVVAAEPRFYYNLNRRNAGGRDVRNNAGNFLAINTMLIPGIVFASSEDIDSFTGSISLTPIWGIRRNIGRSFDYELGAGIGYAFGFDGSSGVTFRTHLRIGYRF